MTIAFLPLRYTWRNVLARKGATAVTPLGVAVSVMAYVVITATAAGISRVAVGTGDPRNLIVLSEGATSAEGSRLTRAAVEAIRYFPGVARDAQRRAARQPRAARPTTRSRAAAAARRGRDARFTSVRGVTPRGARRARRRARARRAAGPPQPGEVMIGRLLGPALGGVGIGDTLEFGARPHRVVGIFEARGQIFEGEVWMPLEQLAAEQAQRDVSAVVLRVADPQALPAVHRGAEDVAAREGRRAPGDRVLRRGAARRRRLRLPRQPDRRAARARRGASPA